MSNKKIQKKAPIISVTLHYKVEREDDDYTGVDLQQVKAVLMKRLLDSESISDFRFDGSWLAGFKTVLRRFTPDQVAKHINGGD